LEIAQNKGNFRHFQDCFVTFFFQKSVGEFGATILFAGNLEGLTQTMPLAIYLGFERNLDVAVVLSVVLILASLILLVIMRKMDEIKVY
jgi:molybdate transport system permease protein